MANTCPPGRSECGPSGAGLAGEAAGEDALRCSSGPSLAASYKLRAASCISRAHNPAENDAQISAQNAAQNDAENAAQILQVWATRRTLSAGRRGAEIGVGTGQLISIFSPDTLSARVSIAQASFEHQ